MGIGQLTLDKSYVWTPERVRIDRIVDGDTIDVYLDMGFNIQTKQRLRLLGIDTPEITGKSKPEGLKAKEYLSDRLEHPLVSIVTYKAGKFGRFLAEVFVEGVNINEEMIEKGYAKKYE